MEMPLHPTANMIVYIFSLFNENLKPKLESSFGLFYLDERKVYDLHVKPTKGDSWCVADPAIHPRVGCYDANMVEAHASYTMNSYYQRGKAMTSALVISGASVGSAAEDENGILALDWACEQGGADYSPIQPRTTCYEPNIEEAHASYTINIYYQQ
ncbi:hypothetical protein Taro_005175 [Colocasia esculenta]|uniref:X8 domain-containing protein n=1 Tax=Colocasia esculenta TaxID=4460 RepID=A0A843TK87_COLES|nr:hypothetical protein [Colocasia esculenta]